MQICWQLLSIVPYGPQPLCFWRPWAAPSAAGWGLSLIHILTQCFAETIIGTLINECHKRNNDIKMICAETRPYFQGARLTASVACDMGVDVTVITDNMPGFIMREKKVDVFTSAADVITMDGYVVNKVGTFQIALAASYHNIPYFVTGTPGRGHETIDTVKIEYRDPELVMEMCIRDRPGAPVLSDAL